jgi:hypothetical protein
VAYLQRALAECPAPPERRELLLDIGKAESQLHAPQAPGHLREALALAEHPDEVAAVALWLGQALYHSGALDEAFDILRDVVERTDGPASDATLELEAYLLSIAGAAGKMTDTARRAASLEAPTPVDSRAAGAVQATLAFREVLTGGPRERVRVRAERAVDDVQRSLASSSHLSDRQAPGASLLWIDELDRASSSPSCSTAQHGWGGCRRSRSSPRSAVTRRAGAAISPTPRPTSSRSSPLPRRART